MTSTTVRDEQGSVFPVVLYKKPFIAPLAFITVFLWMAVGHSMTVLMHSAFPGDQVYIAGLVLGFAALALIWQGFGKDDVTATYYGAAGGALLWIGWFEFAFKFMGKFLHVPNLEYQGALYFTPGIQMIEATALPLLGVLVLLGLNKDTRCRMFKWFHKNLKLKAEPPTVNYRRQYSRITAMEFIFITWAIYIIDLVVLDPRILGPESTTAMIIMMAYIGWCLYLLYKLPQQSEVGLGMRYGMATAIVVWMIPETASAAQMITEIWLLPYDYPVTVSLITISMLVFGTILCFAPKPPLPKKSTQAT